MIKLAPISVVFGANSSGKTSLLQFLLMLKQIVESQDQSRVLHPGDSISLVDLGTYHDLIHNHNIFVPLGFELSWDISTDFEQYPRQKGRRPNFLRFQENVEWNTEQGHGRPVVKSFSYRLGKLHIGMHRENQTGGDLAYALDSDNYPAKRRPGRPMALPAPKRFYGFPPQIFDQYSNLDFLPSWALQLEEFLRKVVYIGPLREHPQRSYSWAGDRPLSVGTQGRLAVDALLAAREAGIKIGRGKGARTFQDTISEWLRRMDLIDSFTLEPIAENRRQYELRVRTTPEGEEVFITDVGFGVSQILPILVQAYYAEPNSVIVLEQPEIHLHPRVQSLLADVFIDAVNKRDNIQFIVESHSEHFLRRLQRRIAENEISDNKTALYFCTMPGEASHIERLTTDECGNITNWPSGFFGDEMGELAAMVKAQFDRKTRKGGRR